MTKSKTIILIILTSLFFFSCTEKQNNNHRIVGYLPLWESARWDSIDITSLTHCILSFATYSADGKIGWNISDDSVNTLVARCKRSNVKTMIALGGFGGFNTDGNPFATSDKRANIINQLTELVNRYDIDGVDIDIEIAATDSIWIYFDDFITELRTSLGDDRLTTMAVGTWFTDAVEPKTFQRLDFINMMAYDNAFGDGDVAPVSMANDMINYYTEKGVDRDRMVLGVPFYGYSEGGVTRHWYEIISLDPSNIDRDYDPVNGIYFNGLATLKQKIEISRSCGGIMIWQIAEDDLGDNSMLRIINHSLKK